jgi:hypothetical protein
VLDPSKPDPEAKPANVDSTVMLSYSHNLRNFLKSSFLQIGLFCRFLGIQLAVEPSKVLRQGCVIR